MARQRLPHIGAMSGPGAVSETALHEQRTHVETDLLHRKNVFDAEHFHARREDVFRQEPLASIVFYNLVTRFRRALSDATLGVLPTVPAAASRARLISDAPERSTSENVSPAESPTRLLKPEVSAMERQPSVEEYQRMTPRRSQRHPLARAEINLMINNPQVKVLRFRDSMPPGNPSAGASGLPGRLDG